MPEQWVRNSDRRVLSEIRILLRQIREQILCLL